MPATKIILKTKSRSDTLKLLGRFRMQMPGFTSLNCITDIYCGYQY